MSFTAQTYRVLIASPSDLSEERQAATEVIHEWNAQHSIAESIVLLPVMWETHARPQSGIGSQPAINNQFVKDCDILIGMFWSKIGTKTQVAESGTVEEIDQFIADRRPAMLYFSDRPIQLSKVDIKQLGKLKKFQAETYKKALIGSFKSLDELRHILLRHLVSQIRELKSAKHSKDNEKQFSLITSTFDRTKLEVGFESVFPFYRISINNAGTNVARGVEVWLEQVWGSLYYPIEEHLPHRLRTRDAKEIRCDINPSRGELFEFITSSIGEPDKGIRFDIDGIRIYPYKNIRMPADYLTLTKSEHLHFWIKVCCANADGETAVFFAQQFEHTITLARIS
jgi:hypothetical protein